MAERTAKAVWEGDLSGHGTFDVGSGAITGQQVTWASRTEEPEGMTSPEELIAAAHASCFSMAFSNGLKKAGATPERLETTATCTLERGDAGFSITRMDLAVTGRVSGIDADGFREAAEAAKEGCPVSGALKGNVEIGLSATLEG